MDLGIHSGFGAVFQIFLSSCVQGHPTTWVGVFQIFFQKFIGRIAERDEKIPQGRSRKRVEQMEQWNKNP